MSTYRLGAYRQKFSSENFLGIPDLLTGALWKPKEAFNLRVCGYTPLNKAEGCVFAYWTEDFRFHATWTKPLTVLKKLVQAHVIAVVEPDHSTYTDDPLIEQMHAVYRSRWTGRFWQEYGLQVVPNVAWSTPQSLEFTLLGIPHRPPMIAIEGRPKSRDVSEWKSIAAEVCRRLQPQSVLLYGATAEMAASIPCRVIAFEAASPRRGSIPVRLSQSHPD